MSHPLPQRRRHGLRQEWYSICSKHYFHDAECHLCNIGSWEYVWLRRFSGFVYDHFPNFWRWWVNHKYFKKIKFTDMNDEVKNPFPNMKP